MNNKTIEKLVELDVYTARALSEEKYNNLSNNNTEDSLIYISGKQGDGSKYFKEINTKGMSVDDVKLQLEIDRTKYVRSIKAMVTFFVVIAVIAILFAIFNAVSASNVLNSSGYYY